MCWEKISIKNQIAIIHIVGVMLVYDLFGIEGSVENLIILYKPAVSKFIFFLSNNGLSLL